MNFLSKCRISILHFTFVLTSSLLLATFASLGCASPEVSEELCRDVNWLKLGAEQAEALDPFQTPDTYSGCPVNSLRAAEMKVGYESALTDLCTQQQGFESGIKGREPLSFCPPQLAEAYAKSYKSGLEVFRLEREQEFVSSQIQSVLEDLTERSMSDLERSSLKNQMSKLEQQKKQLSLRLNTIRSKNL